MNSKTVIRTGERTVEILEVRPSTWPVFEEVLGPSGGPGGCWCSYFRLTAREFREFPPKQRWWAVRAAVQRGEPLGLVAVVNGTPAGWVAVAPRGCYHRLKRSVVARVPEEDHAGIWSVVCFYVARDARGSGLTATLLRAAVEHAGNHGARIVEGYPVEPNGRINPDDLYHGALDCFLQAGFRLVERRCTRRALVRLRLDARGKA